jgi:ABC-type Fe3+/spermidine/putrescine transport system ATPase subunit
MDEPLGALDRKLRAEMQLEIRRIQNLLGITTVYVTHDQEEALTISDRVAIVHDGRIEQIGSPSDVYRRPTSAFVAEFVGDSNLFFGQIDFSEPGQTHLHAAGLRFSVDVPEDSRIGPACIAMVRPESVVVSREPTPLCVHRGIVTQIVYLGSVLRIQIKAAGSLVAAAINPSLTSEIPSEGEEVCFGWQKQNAVLLPAGVNPGRPQCEQEFGAR